MSDPTERIERLERLVAHLMNAAGFSERQCDRIAQGLPPFDPDAPPPPPLSELEQRRMDREQNEPWDDKPWDDGEVS